MSIRFPDVPLTDGVPPVLRSVIAPVTSGIAMMTADSAGLESAQNGEWGIYDEAGKQVLKADSIEAVENSAEARSATYPITGGGFESYNKVRAPFSVRVEMTKSGKKLEKRAFLELLERLRDSTELLSVAVPERAYTNVTLGRYEVLRNTDNGPQAMKVSVTFDEIRTQAQVRFGDGKTPNAIRTESNGSVQASSSARDLVEEARSARWDSVVIEDIR